MRCGSRTLINTMGENTATVELSRFGEAYDVAGDVYYKGEGLQLLGETYSECWAHATWWLALRGVTLEADYEIEYERGDSSYVFHEQIEL